MNKTTIYTPELEEELSDLANRYQLTRVRIETLRAKQEYNRTEANPALHRTRNQVIVRKGSRYAVRDVPEGTTPESVWLATEAELKQKLAAYNKQYQQENREKLRTLNRLNQRKRRAEKRELKNTIDSRGN